MIISHIRPPQDDTEQWLLQSNEDHQTGVSRLAASFASEFGLSDIARLAGLLHDKGKEQPAFQSYIRNVSGYDTSQGSSRKVPHAYVGALIAKQIFPKLHILLSQIIIGHHRGLYDFSEFVANLEKYEIPKDIVVEYLPEISMPRLSATTIDFHHVIRMLFSCLVDADWLDTELFMNESNSRSRGGCAAVSELLPHLENYLAKLKDNAKPTPLNGLRSKIQQLCLDSSSSATGFYSLSVPTGGGKTLSSLLWAVHHCIKHNKQRIIIAIPYTTIITQTAQILRDIFGSDNVLEHHSATSPNASSDSTEALKQKLATENWDYPIIVTTNVQLFESIYSNRTSTCRKLHNICNSVLILDETQVLPLEYLQPILDSLKSYERLFGVSVLFTSASLPAYRSSVLEKAFSQSKKSQLCGFENITEIIPASLDLHKLLKRTELHFDNDESSYDDIVARIVSHPRVLCVVNTRKDALEIFNRLPDDGYNIHLSRMMCSSHLSWTIATIKSILKQDATTPIRVISTQLIEAGVDIDFPVVYRAEAGLDSILQAAGRCNREGSIEGFAPVYVFKLDRVNPRGFISHGINSLKNLTDISDWHSPETMIKYFIQLYSRIDTFDKPLVKENLYTTSPCFEKVSDAFKLIDDNTRTVIVNYGKSAELIAKLKTIGINYQLRKELLQYSVNLRQYDFDKLLNTNLLEEVISGIYFLADREQYSDKIGLQLESHFLEELLIK